MTPSKSTKNRPYQVHGFHTLQRALEAIQDFDKWLESQGDAAKPLRLLRRR
jgi:hypothetical protein